MGGWTASLKCSWCFVWVSLFWFVKHVLMIIRKCLGLWWWWRYNGGYLYQLQEQGIYEAKCTKMECIEKKLSITSVLLFCSILRNQGCLPNPTVHLLSLVFSLWIWGFCTNVWFSNQYRSFGLYSECVNFAVNVLFLALKVWLFPLIHLLTTLPIVHIRMLLFCSFNYLVTRIVF